MFVSGGNNIRFIYSNIIHIYYVDDDKDDHYFFEQALKETEVPARLSYAADGIQLLSLLEANSDLPGIIFLDIRMPSIDGIATLESIRENQMYKDIPIIIFSAMYNPGLVRNAYEKGAQLFLKKPNDFEGYKLILKSLLTGTTDFDSVIEFYIQR